MNSRWANQGTGVDGAMSGLNRLGAVAVAMISFVATGCTALPAGVASPEPSVQVDVTLAPISPVATEHATVVPTGSATRATVLPSSDALPADVYRLGAVRLATDAEAVGALTSAEALARSIDEGYSWPNPSLYLVVITRDVLDSADKPITNRLAWLIRSDDLNVDAPHPAGASGTFQPFRYGYVLIDARTGRFLVATYMD